MLGVRFPKNLWGENVNVFYSGRVVARDGVPVRSTTWSPTEEEARRWRVGKVAVVLRDRGAEQERAVRGAGGGADGRAPGGDEPDLTCSGRRPALPPRSAK